MNKGENILRVLLAIFSLILLLAGIYGWLHKVDGYGWFLGGCLFFVCLLVTTYEDEEAPSEEEEASK
jgi:hypothetical protein